MLRSTSRGPQGPRCFGPRFVRRAAITLAIAAIVVAAPFACASPASARIVDVARAGSDTTDVLEAAIVLAQPGDTLRLAPDTYRGTHTLPPGVSLIGRAGPDSTILDAAGDRWCLFGFSLDETSTIAGLTFRNGVRPHNNSGGGGLHLRNSSARVLGNVFEHHLGYLGAGIWAFQGSRPIIAYNVFRDCEGHLGGGVAAYFDSDLLLYANQFRDCAATSGGAALFMRSAAYVAGNAMIGNRAGTGSAMYFDGSPACVEGNWMEGNRESEAVWCLQAENAPALRGNVFHENDGIAGGKSPEFLDVDGNREARDPSGRVEKVALPQIRSWTGAPSEVPKEVIAKWREWIAAHALPANPPPPADSPAGPPVDQPAGGGSGGAAER